ncbi:MAG: hypothetical protein K6A65_07005 [Succinivibrionaceae bacterium]|nr:hypothetical protein [Succinivibrionaceae bacterium]
MSAPRPALALLLALLIAMLAPLAAQASAWDAYKARFVTPQGAVIDTYNGGITHSESQGYGLMFALAYNDRATFDLIHRWTVQNLRNPKNGLFYWVYHHNDANHLPDKNNASDGDLFIAWALLKAGKAWNIPEMVVEAEHIANNLVDTVVTKYAGLEVMLPGETGFYYNSSVILNPSYLIFPAFSALAKHTHARVWQQLLKDSGELMGRIEKSQSKIKIAPDWLSLNAAGKVEPAREWPARSSFDAIRVPLYLFWNNPADPHLNAWRSWFQGHAPALPPAWVNVTSGETAPYRMPAGMQAVRDLISSASHQVQEPTIAGSDDYYMASLKMLCYLALRQF